MNIESETMYELCVVCSKQLVCIVFIIYLIIEYVCVCELRKITLYVVTFFNNPFLIYFNRN